MGKPGNQRSDRESNQIGNIEKEHALGYPVEQLR